MTDSALTVADKLNLPMEMNVDSQCQCCRSLRVQHQFYHHDPRFENECVGRAAVSHLHGFRDSIGYICEACGLRNVKIRLFSEDARTNPKWNQSIHPLILSVCGLCVCVCE